MILAAANFANINYNEHLCPVGLQELKLQGIKICDGVVFSRYSRAQCFAIKLSDFGNLPDCLCSSVGRAFESQSGQPLNIM